MQNVETGNISRAAQPIETKFFCPDSLSGSFPVKSETRVGKLGGERINNELAACEVGAG